MKFFQLTRNERLGLIGVLVLFLLIILFKYFDAQVTFDYKPSSIEHKKELTKNIVQQLNTPTKIWVNGHWDIQLNGSRVWKKGYWKFEERSFQEKSKLL